jgi:hypothetical protein
MSFRIAQWQAVQPDPAPVAFIASRTVSIGSIAAALSISPFVTRMQ